jgi:hypothetical protein
MVMAAMAEGRRCRLIENYLKLWEKLQRNMERFSYVQNNQLMIQGAEAVIR